MNKEVTYPSSPVYPKGVVPPEVVQLRSRQRATSRRIERQWSQWYRWRKARVRPVLDLGSKHPDVKLVKHTLKDCGYKDLGETDEFDEATRFEVMKFQHDWGIEVNGIVDNQTWFALREAEDRGLPNEVKERKRAREESALAERIEAQIPKKLIPDWLKKTLIGGIAMLSVRELMK